jgi:hypothetical protein
VHLARNFTSRLPERPLVRTGRSLHRSSHAASVNDGLTALVLASSVVDISLESIIERFRSSLDRAMGVAVTGEAPGPLLM